MRQIGRVEVAVVENGQPDRLEGWVENCALLCRNYPQRVSWIEMACVTVGCARTERSEHRNNPTAVEEGQGIPECVVWGQQEARLRNLLALTTDRLVSE